MKNKLELSYTRINAFLTCRQRYVYEYQEDLTPKEKASALVTGDIVHKLLDAYYSNRLQPGDIEHIKEYAIAAFPNNDPDQLANDAFQAALLFNTYIQTFEDDEMTEVRSPELHLEKDFGDFSLYSRLDGLIFYKAYNGVFRLEHKTTSKTSSIYLSGLSRGLQTGIAHWLAEELLDEPLKGSVFNLLVKTKIPTAQRSAPLLMNKQIIEKTKETVYGVVRSIERNDFYPSMQCTLYNKPCDFYAICQENDTPNKRRELFMSREEMKKKAGTLGIRLYDEVDAGQTDQEHKHFKESSEGRLKVKKGKKK